jgi:hypothetical protein
VTVLTGQAVREILAATVTPPPESLQEQGITHWSSRRLADWLGRPGNQRITLHVTPAGCSRLNLVECFLSVLTRQAIRRGSFTSARQPTAATGAFTGSWNDHPRPFAWTKDTDEILASIQRAKTKTKALTDH